MYKNLFIMGVYLCGYVVLCVHARSYRLTVRSYVHQLVPHTHLRSALNLRVVILAVFLYGCTLLFALLQKTITLRAMLTVFYLIHAGLAIYTASGALRRYRGVFYMTIYFWWMLTWGTSYSSIHNIVLMGAYAWFASISRSLPRYLRPYTLILAFFWLIYDVYAVWGSSLSDGLVGVLVESHVPLWISVGKYGIGTGDLLFLALLIGYIDSARHAWLVGVGCVALSMFSFVYFTGAFALPLLAVWVPGGLFLIQIEKKVADLLAKIRHQSG